MRVAVFCSHRVSAFSERNERSSGGATQVARFIG